MKYIICERPGEFSIKSKEEPVLTKDTVLLRVKRVGICGTDLHAFKGEQPYFVYPRILGHELATEIVDIGENPLGLRPGDRVVTVPYIHCQQCEACKVGKTNCCQRLQVVGVHTDGGMQEIISFPKHLILRGSEFSFDELAIIEPLAIGAHALRRAQTQDGDWIVIMGCGPIGLGIIQLAKFIGARVIALDINEHRLRVAQEKFQADAAFPPSVAAAEQIREVTNGAFANAVIDATGNRHAIEGALRYIRHGGSIVLVGLTREGLTFHHPDLHAKETSVLCSRNATVQDFGFAMKVLRQKRFNTEAYITRRTAFENIPREFPQWGLASSNDIKILTEWNG